MGTGERVLVVVEVCGLGVLVAKMLPDPTTPDTMRIGGLSLFTREQIAFNEIDSVHNSTDTQVEGMRG